MIKFTLHIGESYIAQIELDESQLSITNDAIAQDFVNLGFTTVTVTGEGGTRTITGKWEKDNSEWPEHTYRVESWKKL